MTEHTSLATLLLTAPSCWSVKKWLVSSVKVCHSKILLEALFPHILLHTFSLILCFTPSFNACCILLGHHNVQSNTTAHCVSEGTDFCSECSGPAVCPVNDICYCSSECFHTGNCCPDVDQLLTCLRKYVANKNKALKSQTECTDPYS